MASRRTRAIADIVFAKPADDVAATQRVFQAADTASFVELPPAP